MLLARRGQLGHALPCRCLCISSNALGRILGIDLGASTHEEVRAAYVQKALKTHPDHNRDVNAAEQMVHLQNSWREYLCKFRKSQLLSHHSGGFTEFGVGCSFDDNEEEAARRAALVEQASRGVMNQPTLSQGGREHYQGKDTCRAET